MKNLNPKAVTYFFFTDVFGFLTAFAILAIFLGSFALETIGFSGIVMLFFALLILSLPFAFVWAKLKYNNWSYDFSNEAVVIEKGVIWKKKSYIPYDRIQNVDIVRGPLLRMLSLSAVQIQTAGYSGASKYGWGQIPEGEIPALSIADAEKIRTFLVSKAKGRQKGL